MALFHALQGEYANPARDCVDMAEASARAKFLEPDITWLYNPVGKSLISASASWFHPYAARMCDLSAHAQLVRAQLEIGAASVPSSEVPRYLAAHPQLANPLTRNAFGWSPGARVLWFTPNDHRWVCTEGDVVAEIPPPAQ